MRPTVEVPGIASLVTWMRDSHALDVGSSVCRSSVSASDPRNVFGIWGFDKVCYLGLAGSATRTATSKQRP